MINDVFPTTIKGKGRKWGPMAAWMNRIGAALNNIRGGNGIRAYWVGDVLHLEAVGGGVGGGGFSEWPARIEWDGTAEAYDWAEQVWDADESSGGHYIDKSGGRQTADITGGTGSGTLPRAKEQSGLEDLPDSLVVWMRSVVDDTGSLQYLFRVPINGQNSPESVGTADATDVSAASDSWGLVGVTGRGCTLILQTRTSYDSSNHKLVAHFRTLEVDPAGVLRSASVESTQDMLQLDQVTMVTALQVTATHVQYKDRTAWVVDAGAESSWQNLNSTVCP